MNEKQEVPFHSDKFEKNVSVEFFVYNEEVNLGDTSDASLRLSYLVPHNCWKLHKGGREGDIPAEVAKVILDSAVQVAMRTVEYYYEDGMRAW